MGGPGAPEDQLPQGQPEAGWSGTPHGSTMLCKGLKKYQHVEKIGDDQCHGLLLGRVFVQEKLDGSNATVANVPGVGFVVATRNHAISINGEPPTGLRGLVEYVLQHRGIAQCLERHPEWILRGEWLTPHTILYPAHAYNKFYVFDVETYDGAYIPAWEYRETLSAYGIHMVPEIGVYDAPHVEDLLRLCTGPSLLSASDQDKVEREGIVIKRYDWEGNRYGRIAWGKIVGAEFRERMGLRFGPQHKQGYDERWAEIKFGSLVTNAFVEKIITKIRDAQGDASVRDMPRILGVAWYEMFTEVLWDFVKKNGVRDFNFHYAQKYVTAKARDIALAYFAGLALPDAAGTQGRATKGGAE